jgi:ubiquinone/menaquinone biosynthesis C-methylase UbiE
MIYPNYPIELFRYLRSISPTNNYAWDCGTGTGGSAICLSENYNNVFASDQKLSYIKLAPQKSNILYIIENVENNSIPNNTIDLITVAQSLHHFKINYFFKEVQRVLKPSGILASWCFGEHKIDKILKNNLKLFFKLIDPFWGKEKDIINNGYKKINFPLTTIHTKKKYSIEALFSYKDYIDYLGTLSATRRFKKNMGYDPRQKISSNLLYDWGGIYRMRKIKWPIQLFITQQC